MVDVFFKTETIKALRKAGCTTPAFTGESIGWRGLELDTAKLKKEDLPIIRKVLAKPELWEHLENRRVIRKLDAVAAMEAHGPKKAIIKRLELLADALRQIIGKTPHKWVFQPEEPFGVMLPWFVSSVKFHPADHGHDRNVPARVVITGKAISRGHTVDRSFTFERDALKGKLTAEEILAKDDGFLETPELVAHHQKEVEEYRKEAPRTGEQYLGRGRAEGGGSRWHHDHVSLEREGVPSKLIVDDTEEQGTDSGWNNTTFWTTKGSTRGEDDDEDEDGEKAYALPVHPLVRAFNLSTHHFVFCHISTVSRYVYDEKASEKLILPAQHQELIDALTDSAVQKMEDIIRGKAIGIIVACSGVPGTGKTLTAEVYSEAAKRPLYTVQCSQLGTNEEELEEKLTTVLGRATRWRAILLIDEADVYIHQRGEDLQQNAIVGVFLRVLEYFNGILFMTTNRVTVVDDAILSRVTAHVHYSIPDNDHDRGRLWNVLATQYGAKELNIKAAMHEFPKVSGRTIRQLIRLSKIMADRKKKKVDVAMLKWAASFHDFTEGEENPFKEKGDK